MTLDATPPTEKLLEWLKDFLFAISLVEKGEDTLQIYYTVKAIRSEMAGTYDHITSEVDQAVEFYLASDDNAPWPTWTNED